jgi:hypothetical protein
MHHDPGWTNRPQCDAVINLIGHVMRLQSEHGQSEHFGLSDDKMYEPLSRRAESYHDSHPALLRLHQGKPELLSEVKRRQVNVVRQLAFITLA